MRFQAFFMGYLGLQSVSMLALLRLERRKAG
jgi:F0F1-type ATP synthase assembly protein I